MKQCGLILLAPKAAARRTMLLGIALCLGGVIITVVGATSGTSYFLVFWGAIIFGPIMAVRAALAMGRIDEQLVRNVSAVATRFREQDDKTAYGIYLNAHGNTA